jgi:lincosamide nucleotidyltransferase A/C/D/E
MTAEDVIEIIGWLKASGVDVWLDGGWGVDALVCEQTRQHKDLDLIVRDAHDSAMREVLADHGFTEREGNVANYVLTDGGGRDVDVHPVAFDDRGDGHLVSHDGGSFGHPAAAFASVGTVLGQRMACLSAEAQMSNHAWGYRPGDTDFHDMRLLHERLGTPLLPPFSAGDAQRRRLIDPPR